jgi:hypothetical protein
MDGGKQDLEMRDCDMSPSIARFRVRIRKKDISYSFHIWSIVRSNL